MTCGDVRDHAPAFVLGALDLDEEQAVSAHLESCPDAHAEFAEYAAAVTVLTESVPLVEPPPALKGRILAAAARDLEERRRLDVTTASAAATVGAAEVGVPATPAHIEAAAPPAPAGRRAPETADHAPARVGLREFFDMLLGRTRGAWTMRAVAVVAIVALAGWNLALQGELAGTRSYQNRLDEALALAQLPGAQLALLAPPEGGNGPRGVAVMPPTGQGRLVMTGLRPTSGNQVYEAWAILDGQSPVPVGGFRVGADGIGYFDEMPPAGGEAVVVAITLEPGPNPTAPSSDPISLGLSAPVATVPSAA
jgi:anti-sigma factor RsiW